MADLLNWARSFTHLEKNAPAPMEPGEGKSKGHQMSNLYRNLPGFANGKDKERLAAQVVPLFNKTNEAVRAYFDDIGNRGARQWPSRLRAHPYNFSWPGEDCRDLFLNMLFTSIGGRTRFVTKDLMRFLMYRFNIAKALKAPPLAEMKGYCWHYFAMAELCMFLGRDERQLQDEVKWLVDQGLLVRVLAKRSQPYPYMRPSDDLFRLCITVTMMNDADYLRALNDGGKLVPDEERDHREACRAVFKEHGADLHRLVQDFMTSDEPDRAAVFCAGYHALAAGYWPTDGGDDDDERYAEGMQRR